MAALTGIDAAGVNVRRRGLMLVLSSPSGAGKTSISRTLLDRDANLELSISVTTRPKRRGEQAGHDYIFVDPTEFNLMVNRHELLEHAKVFDFYYGTPRGPVEQALTAGRDILFDIDSSILSVTAQGILEQVGEVLLEFPKTAVVVQGFTDSTGSEAHNQSLSERRAGSVRNYFIGRGVDAVRMVAVGYGEGQPVASNDNPDGRTLNRRVNILLKAKAK